MLELDSKSGARRALLVHRWAVPGVSVFPPNSSRLSVETVTSARPRQTSVAGQTILRTGDRTDGFVTVGGTSVHTRVQVRYCTADDYGRRGPHLRFRQQPLFDVTMAAPGPPGSLPLSPADLLHRPSGDIFGWTQDVGMGWKATDLQRPEVLILSTLAACAPTMDHRWRSAITQDIGKSDSSRAPPRINCATIAQSRSRPTARIHATDARRERRA